MDNSSLLALDDWQDQYHLTSAIEGWTLVDTDELGGNRIAIECSSGDSKTEEEVRLAVICMKNSYQAKNVNAIAAHKLLLKHSYSEFEYWGLSKW